MTLALVITGMTAWGVANSPGILSVIMGNRALFWGLCIGETAASEWHELMGEPDYTADLDEEAAEYARTVPGTCDYYLFGEYRLQLLADTDGRLAGITIAK